MLYGFLCYKSNDKLGICKENFRTYKEVEEKTIELKKSFDSVVEINIDALYDSFVNNLSFDDLSFDNFSLAYDFDKERQYAINLIKKNSYIQSWVVENVREKLYQLKDEIIVTTFDLATLFESQPFDFSSGLYNQKELYYDFIDDVKRGIDLAMEIKKEDIHHIFKDKKEVINITFKALQVCKLDFLYKDIKHSYKIVGFFK